MNPNERILEKFKNVFKKKIGIKLLIILLNVIDNKIKIIEPKKILCIIFNLFFTYLIKSLK